MKSVQLWNADVDVPDEKRPLLQRIALKEAYEWQKEVFTKPPTRRRNPEPAKPKYEASQAEQVRTEKKAFLMALKSMYKSQVYELKLAKRRQKAAARGEPLPDDISMSDDDLNPSGGEDEASESVDDGKSVSGSVAPKTGRWARRGGRSAQHAQSINSPTHHGSDHEDGDIDDKHDEEKDDVFPDGSSSAAPDVGTIDELTEIDLTSAIQRGKFILRARRNETPPPKKRKYTRRNATSPPVAVSSSLSSPKGSMTSKSSDINSNNEDGGSGDEESDRNGKKRFVGSNRSLSRSSQRISREASPYGAYKEAESPSVKNSELSEQDELEALKLTNTIAARRKLRRSGHQGVQGDELLSLPLPTRTRAKSAPKESHSNVETPSVAPDPVVTDSMEPSSPTTSAPGTVSNNAPQAKKTGRGKYIRKGKRDSPAPEPLPDALCASCALARPNFTRHSLGWFMFYMLEDLSASLRLQQPQYGCVHSECGAAFYTELELKAHIMTHYNQMEQLYALPPTKKRKEDEDMGDVEPEINETEPKSSSSTTSKASNPIVTLENLDTVANGTHGTSGTNGCHMDEDVPEFSAQTPTLPSKPVEEDPHAMVLSETVKPKAKEVTYYECTYPDCADGDGEPNLFESETLLHAHVKKAHCGGLEHRLCVRCCIKPVYSGTASTPPVRTGRYTKLSASPATNCVHGKGRKLPFEPIQGLSEPNMIPLPMINLSYHPPTPIANVVPSTSHSLDPSSSMPHSSTHNNIHTSPTAHSNSSRLGGINHASHHHMASQDENDDRNTDDDTDRPKRSTRIRRSSAAASQTSSYISSPYGTTAKHMRAAAAAAAAASPSSSSTSAPAPAPSAPIPASHSDTSLARTTKHTPMSPPSHPTKKTSKKLSHASNTNKTTQMPPPSSLPPPARPQLSREVEPAPSDMNAFLDLINLCSSIVD